MRSFANDVCVVACVVAGVVLGLGVPFILAFTVWGWVMLFFAK